MRTIMLLIVALASVAGGCGTLVVKKAERAGEFHGVPFYVKTAGCKHQVVRLEPYFALTLTTKDGEKVLSTEATTLSFSQFKSKEVTDLRSALAGKGSSAGSSIRTLWDKVRAMHYNPHIKELENTSEDWFIVSDVVSPYVYVDYKHPYTLNSRRPAIGSAQVSAKLGEDGTLSEASGQGEDKTLSTFLGLIPTTDLIKSAAGIVGFDGAGTFTIELAIQEKGVKFTRTYWLKDTFPPCSVDAEARREVGPYDLTVEELGAEKKSSDEDAIKVNGTIQLPKPKEPKK